MVGNLGLIRRSLIQDEFKGKEEMVLNYDPHPSPRAGISQIIYPKEHVHAVVDGLKSKKIVLLPETYNTLELSPRSKRLGKRREAALKGHQLEVMRNWERCAIRPRDETIAQYFELLLRRAKKAAAVDNEKDKDAMETSEEEKDEEQGRKEVEEEIWRKETNRTANKENENPTDDQNRSSQTNQKQKPLARARKPSGTPLRHMRKKKDSNQRNAEKGLNINEVGDNQATVILTEEKQLKKEAEIVSAMLNIAGEGAASSGGILTKD